MNGSASVKTSLDGASNGAPCVKVTLLLTGWIALALPASAQSQAIELGDGTEIGKHCSEQNRALPQEEIDKRVLECQLKETLRRLDLEMRAKRSQKAVSRGSDEPRIEWVSVRTPAATDATPLMVVHKTHPTPQPIGSRVAAVPDRQNLPANPKLAPTQSPEPDPSQASTNQHSGTQKLAGQKSASQISSGEDSASQPKTPTAIQTASHARAASHHQPTTSPHATPTPTTAKKRAPDAPPVPAPTSDSATVVDAERVTAGVRQWAQAWSSQQPDRYLGFYASDYSPRGMTRTAWQTQRRQRLRAPAFIQVTLGEIQIRATDAPHTAIATFRQEYKSDRFADVVQKTLTFKLKGEALEIVRESAVPYE